MINRNTARKYTALCCVTLLLGIPQAKGKGKVATVTYLQIPHNYQETHSAIPERSGNIHRRSLSAWTWKINHVENRIPQTIFEAVCNFNYCINPKSSPDEGIMDENINAVPINQEVMVLKLNESHNFYQASYISVAVGCTCVQAKTTQINTD